jgi:tetratricopeptide (TPR) repeat protein
MNSETSLPKIAFEHYRAGRIAETGETCKKILANDPNDPFALHLLGVVEWNDGRHDRAIGLMRRSVSLVSLPPLSVEYRNNLGLVLKEAGRVEEAEVSFRDALRIKPDDAWSHVNLSAVLLLTGRLEEGWNEFEWRLRLEPRLITQDLNRPQWNGEPAAGRSILLHPEQGLGDTIQFCRYATMFPAGARVILAAPRALARLLTGLRGVDTIIKHGDKFPPYDFQCPLMSLPRAFRTTPSTIPAATHYLSMEIQQAAAWRERLRDLPGYKIGVAWSGNPRPFQPSASAIDRRRSIAFETFSALFECPGVSFVSLQKNDDPHSKKSNPRLHDWTDELQDFADTAALMDALDLVISVDTSVVHLAGALGKPVWLLNRYDTCWRWLLNRNDSPWYPTLRQFRQPAPGDWNSVLLSVRAALRELGERKLD